MIRPSRSSRRSVNVPAHRRRFPGFQPAAFLALFAAIGGDAAKAQTLARLRVGYWPPEQSDGWALRVIKKLN